MGSLPRPKLSIFKWHWLSIPQLLLSKHSFDMGESMQARLKFALLLKELETIASSASILRK